MYINLMSFLPSESSALTAVPTAITKLLNGHLVQSHWWLDDLHLVTFPCHQLCDEQHVGEEEAVDIHLGRKQVRVTVLFARVRVHECVHAYT